MSMGTRRHRQRQEDLWITHNELAQGPAHPFYQRLNELLDSEKFDESGAKQCAAFYAADNNRPSPTPGIYFRLLLLGYFEGIGSERGSPGGRRTRWGCGGFWGSGWMRARRITRPSLGRVG